MRISVDPSDRGYSDFARGSQVYIDGKMVKGAITADEEHGFAYVHATDADGHYMLNEAKDDTLKAHIFGAVRIDLPPWFWAAQMLTSRPSRQ
jgi:hypothetical protein